LISTTTGYYARGDKLKEKGIDPASLKTIVDRREAALAISGPDFYGWGFTPNQSGDGFGFLISVVQAYGGSFTDQTGQVVKFNSPETVQAFEFLRETYDRNGKYAAMLPPGIESWNDTGNNEAYLAGQIGFTQNAFSIYAQSKRDNNPVYPNTLLLRAPTAINGDSRDGGNVGGWMTVFKGAPNAALAKKLALDLLDPTNFNKIASLGSVLFTPAYANLWTDELMSAEPNLKSIKEAVSDMTRMKALLALRGDGFAILGGDDASAARALLAGADGLVSVGSNVLPGAFRTLCDLARAGNHAAAEAWDARLQPYHDFFTLESNPVPVKALLQRLGIGHGLRLPLLPLSAPHHAAADHLAADVGALEELSSH